MQTQNITSSMKQDQQNCLLRPTQKCLPNNMNMALDMLCSKLPSSTQIGDYIGIESCLDLKQNNEDIFSTSVNSRSVDLERQRMRSKRKQQWEMKKRRRDYPPPIPLLARTENLPSHMPWVLRRHYTNDGRLILSEEKVKHHEYFKAHRSNGRLTLQLVPLNNDFFEAPPSKDDQGQETDQTYDEDSNADDDQDKFVGLFESESSCACNKGVDESIEHEGVINVGEEDQRVPSIEIQGDNNQNGVNFLSYNGVITSPNCIFNVLPVPATIRPVRT